MNHNNVLAWICSGVTTLIGATSVEEVARIILLILGIVSGLFSLAYNIYCWYKRAKADGKITPDEIAEAHDIIQKGIDDIKEDK